MTKLNNDQEIYTNLSNLIQETTTKSKEESLAISQKFTKEIEKKLSKNLSDLTEIFSSLDDVTHNLRLQLFFFGGR